MARNYLKGAIGYRLSHQPADDCMRLESETVAAGHFLTVFHMAKNANLSDSLIDI